MKYKVGDYVKVIKRFDKDAPYYNGFPTVTFDMLQMQGNVYEIINATYNSFRDIDSYTLRFGHQKTYIFIEEMIECRVVPIGDGKSFIPYNDNMEVG